MAGKTVPRLVLASLSPRRRKLLRGAGVDFTVAQALVEEDTFAREPPRQAVVRLARAKAQDVSSRFLGTWVLAADTLVALEGRVLGKPRSAQEAEETIAQLAGREHEVLTAVVLVGPDGEIRHEEVVCTTIRFRRLRRCEIRAYVASGEPLDKAGAYGIQGWGGHFVARISGSYTNVIGLPLEAVLEVLADVGLYSNDA